MSFHQDTWDGLRLKGHTVGAVYTQPGLDGHSPHQFVRVDNVAMPIEWAIDLNAGRVTLNAIASRLKG